MKLNYIVKHRTKPINKPLNTINNVISPNTTTNQGQPNRKEAISIVLLRNSAICLKIKFSDKFLDA